MTNIMTAATHGHGIKAAMVKCGTSRQARRFEFEQRLTLSARSGPCTEARISQRSFPETAVRVGPQQHPEVESKCARNYLFIATSKAT
ncbi:MAG: hypothetical protein RIC82_06735 [Parvibaculum sp.]